MDGAFGLVGGGLTRAYQYWQCGPMVHQVGLVIITIPYHPADLGRIYRQAPLPIITTAQETQHTVMILCVMLGYYDCIDVAMTGTCMM